MRTTCFILLLVFTYASSWAQETYTLKGTVKNNQGEALSGSNVMDRASLKGVSSSATGEFTLELSQLPAYLEVSFIGYQTVYKEITKDFFETGAQQALTITLTPRTEQLATVTVTGDAYRNVFTKPVFQVLDYAFVENNTLLLLKYLREYKLQLIDENGDPVSETSLDTSPEGFVIDCLGHIYLQARDTAFALSFASNNIQVLDGVSMEFYNVKVRPCIASNGQNLYYQFYKFNNQFLEYFQSPLAGGETKRIFAFMDRQDAYSIEEYRQSAKRLENSKKGFEMMAWFNTVLAVPIYNPLFSTSTGAVLFNHSSDSVLVLDMDGKPVHRIEINHHRQKHFKDRILLDFSGNTFYAVYEKGGEISLCQLNAKDFSAGKSVKLRNTLFPKKLRIRNGEVYYLNHEGDDYNRLKLYRQRLY